MLRVNYLFLITHLGLSFNIGLSITNASNVTIAGVRDVPVEISGGSTERAALELTDRMVPALDNHNTPLNIFLDLSKAFDTLESYHSIRQTSLLWYPRYLL